MAIVLESLYRHRGLAAVALYSVMCSLEYIFAKVVLDHVHPLEFSTLQFCTQFLVPVPAIVYYRISPLPDTAPIGGYLVLRGALGIANLCALYYAFRHIPVGDVVAMTAGAPVFVAIFARIFLKESLHLKELVSILAAVGGMFLVAQPPFLFGVGQPERGNFSIAGILLALSSCLGAAASAVVTRKLGLLEVSPFNIVLYIAIVGTTGTALLTSISRAWSILPCGRTRLMLTAALFLNAPQQIIMAYAYAIEKAVYVTILQSIKVVFVFLLELWWFDVHPTWPSLVGAGLVMGATILMAVSKNAHGR